MALLPFPFKACGIGARSAPGPSLSPLSALSPSLPRCLCSWGFPDAPSANLHTVCSSLGLSDLQTHSQWPLDRSQDARRENTHLQSGSRCLCTDPLFVPSALGEGEHCALTSWWFLRFVPKPRLPHSSQLACFLLLQSLHSGLSIIASCSFLIVLLCLLPCLIPASPSVVAQNQFSRW